MRKKTDVEESPKTQEIIKALVAQKDYKEISKKYGISVVSLRRYTRDKLLPDISKNVGFENYKRGDYTTKAFLYRMEDITERIQKLYNAYDEWLKSPEDENLYEIGPRAGEMEVVYNEMIEMSNGKMKKIKKIDTLQNLLNRINVTLGTSTIKVNNKAQDPRALFLKTAEVMEGQLKTMASFCGSLEKIQNNTQINIDTTGVLIPNIIHILQRELNHEPELLDKIVKGIRELTYKQVINE